MEGARFGAFFLRRATVGKEVNRQKDLWIVTIKYSI
jgi:hypothetical protein